MPHGPWLDVQRPSCIVSYKMTVNLTEQEMRLALFGNSCSAPDAVNESPVVKAAEVSVKSTPRRTSSPRLRVTLKVTKTFEGVEEIFSYDADTLSSLVAEQEARAAAKRKRFKYFELVSIVSV